MVSKSNYTHLYPEANLQNPELFDQLKQVLKYLEKSQAVIFTDDFNSISLVEPKLRDLVDIPKQIKLD